MNALSQEERRRKRERAERTRRIRDLNDALPPKLLRRPGHDDGGRLCASRHGEGRIAAPRENHPRHDHHARR